MDASDGHEADEPRDVAPCITDLPSIAALIQTTQAAFLLQKVAGPQLTDCTYARGPMTQPIYSCLTCMRTRADGAVEYAALCGSCALHCHGDHDVEEVFNKRDVQCDCPTLASRRPVSPSSSPDAPPAVVRCTLNAADGVYPANASNAYGHNFAGRYCRCDAEYDPDVDVMLQCDVCEDWYHERCLTTPFPTPGDEDLFLCAACVRDDRYDFLVPYWLRAAPPRDDHKEEEAAAEVDLFPDVTRRKEAAAHESELGERKVGTPAVTEVEHGMDLPPGWVCAHCSYFNKPQEVECFGCEKPKKEDLSHASFPPTSSASSSASSLSTPSPSLQSTAPEATEPPVHCTRPTTVPASFSRSSANDLWLSSSWPSTLCACSDCLALYAERAPFLLPFVVPSSPPSSPPPATSSTLVESYLSSLPREQVLNGLSAIEDWNEVVMRELGRLTAEVERGGGERVVTKEMVEEVVREAREECVRRRRRRMEDEENGDEEAIKRARYDE